MSVSVYQLQAELNAVKASLTEATQQLRNKESTITELRTQNEWFRRQLFGEKSERRPSQNSSSEQLYLGQQPPQDEEAEATPQTVKSYQRGKAKKQRFDWEAGESGLRFEDSVPVVEIEVPNPEVEGLSEDEYEVIDVKHTEKLAQRPSAYYIIRYKREVIRLKGGEPQVVSAPPAVLERSYADVSVLAGLLVDKFCYHLPLYRQHQRIKAGGIHLSRATLTNWVARVAELLEGIYHQQMSSVLSSRVLSMDETPIKAGQKKKGKLNLSYFWPIYGELDEVVFPYSKERATGVIKSLLTEELQKGTVLLTDGYQAYEKFAGTIDTLVHARCWSHTRRKFIEAESLEPELVEIALEYIGKLYKVEANARKAGITGRALAVYRQQHSGTTFTEFFSWLKEVLEEKVLLPQNRFTKAASYALKRREGLGHYLYDGDIQIDTNHLERLIRPVAQGKRNWLFCWTEVGAKHVGIIQSLLQTCRLHQIDPFTYLVDVLQRLDQHPKSGEALLTPRLWKQHFGDNPMPPPVA